MNFKIDFFIYIRLSLSFFKNYDKRILTVNGKNVLLVNLNCLGILFDEL